MGQKIRFYTDEHVDKAIVRGLRKRGMNVLRGFEAGLLEAEDEDHLTRATAEGRVIFTQDEDFLKLHASGVNHSGIAYVPQGTAIGRIIRGLMLIYDVLDAEDMVGQVEYL